MREDSQQEEGPVQYALLPCCRCRELPPGPRARAPSRRAPPAAAAHQNLNVTPAFVSLFTLMALSTPWGHTGARQGGGGGRVWNINRRAGPLPPLTPGRPRPTWNARLRTPKPGACWPPLAVKPRASRIQQVYTSTHNHTAAVCPPPARCACGPRAQSRRRRLGWA